MISSRSNSSVRPASNASTAIPAFCAVSTVVTPITGISKRMSCPGLAALTATDDCDTTLNLVAHAIKPVPGEYLVVDGDSLEFLADAFNLTIAQLLERNPGLSAATLTPGIMIKVPKVED